MEHVDLCFPSAAGPYALASHAIYRGHLRELSKHAPLSCAVLALTASGADLAIAWLRTPEAPINVLRTAYLNLRAAEKLARKEAGQRRRMERESKRGQQ